LRILRFIFGVDGNKAKRFTDELTIADVEVGNIFGAVNEYPNITAVRLTEEAMPEMLGFVRVSGERWVVSI